MISNFELMGNPGCIVGGDAMVFLKDQITGDIEVIAARSKTSALLLKAVQLTRPEVSRGRVYKRSKPLERLLNFELVCCTEEYAAAHEQQLPSALRQAKLLSNRIRQVEWNWRKSEMGTIQ
ncbi:MAG: hypothetical protein AAF636_11400 [Pseudomonadota bacterium]